MKGILEGRHDYWIRILESERGIFCVDRFVPFFCSPIVGFNFIFLPISSILDYVLGLLPLSREGICVSVNCLSPLWIIFKYAF